MLKHSTYRARALRCRATLAEQMLWERLRGRQLLGAKFRRQQPLGPYVVDFYCDEAALVIELDGASHFPPPLCDVERDAFLRKCGLTVLRFENRELFDSVERVLAHIAAALPPSPSGRGPG
jgi:very-short-patch-repair endonuclease